MNAFFAWLKKKSKSPLLLRNRRELTVAVHSYKTECAAMSKPSWGVFLSALNIVSWNSGNGFKLTKEENPRFKERGNSDFKHIAYTHEQLNLIFKRTESNLKMHSLVRFLYESIARLQDAFGIKKQPFLDHFRKHPTRSYDFTVASKKSSERKAKISPALMQLIAKFAGSHNGEYIWGADEEWNAVR